MHPKFKQQLDNAEAEVKHMAVCDVCETEDGKHLCECGESMTEPECKAFQGYCSTMCGYKYNK